MDLALDNLQRLICHKTQPTNNCNQTLNIDLYSKQLQLVHENLIRKCPTLINGRNIVFLHKNISSHSARIMQEKCWI